MVGGQITDLEVEGKSLTLKQLDCIHEHKTGELIIAALRGGAFLSKASEQQIEKLTHYGYCIGLAFQIQDDILDIEGDEKELGISIGSDAPRQKVTCTLP